MGWGGGGGGGLGDHAPHATEYCITLDGTISSFQIKCPFLCMLFSPLRQTHNVVKKLIIVHSNNYYTVKKASPFLKSIKVAVSYSVLDPDSHTN